MLALAIACFAGLAGIRNFSLLRRHLSFTIAVQYRTVRTSRCRFYVDAGFAHCIAALCCHYHTVAERECHLLLASRTRVAVEEDEGLEVADAEETEEQRRRLANPRLMRCETK